jgi:hypothetical protein
VVSDGLQLDAVDITRMVAEFRKLPAVLRGPLARGAARAAMTELRDRAIALAPVAAGPEGEEGGPPPGNLKRAIYCMRLPENCTPDIEAWQVSVRKGPGKWKHKRNQGNETNTAGAYYGGWVEFGHWTRTPSAVLAGGVGSRNARRQAHQASGAARWVPAQPYMRPALDSMKNDFGRVMQEYVDRNIGEVIAISKYMKLGG